MAKRSELPKTLTVQDAHLIWSHITSEGGVHTDKAPIAEDEINDGNGRQKTFEAITRIDHVELVKEGTKIATRGRDAVRRYCTRVAGAWICSGKSLRALEREVGRLQEAAADYNARAKGARCARRVTIDVTPIPISIDNAAAAKRIHRAIREELEKCVGLIEEGADDKLHSHYQANCNRLHELAPGMLAMAVADAQRAVTLAEREIRAARKEQRDRQVEPMIKKIRGAVAMFRDLPAPRPNVAVAA